MKKLLAFLTLILLIPAVSATTTYKEAFAQNNKVPMAVLVYADWADNYNTYISEFRKAMNEVGDDYNYVELNIASEDAKEYMELNVILPRPPYIMLFRSNCKFARRLERSCASDVSCIVPKMRSFKRQ